ncbi:MAG: hypothetical protein EP330_08755 [Deltaproteobacteria bacterium]|nr:MAG: hypothetical protein EP330_08755 [Deltaproteobacteria bacterium]
MKAVLAAWGLDGAELQQLSSGLINQTWRVMHEGRETILQSLNTQIFDPVLHEDIAAVTEHLAHKGLPTPRLVPTTAGSLYADVDGGCWRMLTVVGNRTIERVEDLADARSGGALVARFHAATADLEHRFVNPRSQGGFHDTQVRMDQLREALDAHRGDDFWDETAGLAARIEALWASLAGGRELPQRVVHGDLKISNLRYDDADAIALIDLDTLARGTLDAELGDALRSWCCLAGEDGEPAFSLDVLGAAMEGYASEAVGITDAEWDSFVPGTIRIATELAARFAADALNRNYFGFDPALGSGRHNLLRAEGQLALAEQIAAVRDEAQAVVAAARS